LGSRVHEGIPDDRLADAVQEVCRVASPAIHGEPVSDAQVAFVRDLARELDSALEVIRPGEGALRRVPDGQRFALPLMLRVFDRTSEGGQLEP